MKRRQGHGIGREMTAKPSVAAVCGGRMGRKGTILIVTIWITFVLAGMVLVLARAMRVEAICSSNEVSSLQADAVEEGAIQYVLARVDSLQGQTPAEANTPCEAVRIGQGAFWIIRPNYDDDRAYAYGIVDEASKLNLNTASLTMLSNLPDMTDELAPAIVDWRTDANKPPTPGGAKSQYYLLLSDPYQCKSAPLETVEELFLIKGATAEIIFGEDTNRNGVLDTNEDDGDVSDPPDNRDGQLNRGLYPFVTVYSAEPNADANGQARTDVTTGFQSRAALRNWLTQKGISSSMAQAIIDGLPPGKPPFRNLLDFYNSTKTTLTATESQTIGDSLRQHTLKGLINVNTAPADVLLCLGLDNTDVSALLAKRAQAGTDLTTLAWVADALKSNLTPPKILAFGGLITTRSYQFSADIVSVAGDGRAFKRCRIVVDAQDPNSPPKVIYRQDLTQLGWPLLPDILTKLRAGVPIEQIVPAQTITQETIR